MATGGRLAVTCCAAVLLAVALLISAPDAAGSAPWCSPVQSPPSSHSLLFCSCSSTFRCVPGCRPMQPRLLAFGTVRAVVPIALVQVQSRSVA